MHGQGIFFSYIPLKLLFSVDCDVSQNTVAIANTSYWLQSGRIKVPQPRVFVCCGVRLNSGLIILLFNDGLKVVAFCS